MSEAYKRYEGLLARANALRPAVDAAVKAEERRRAAEEARARREEEVRRQRRMCDAAYLFCLIDCRLHDMTWTGGG